MVPDFLSVSGSPLAAHLGTPQRGPPPVPQFATPSPLPVTPRSASEAPRIRNFFDDPNALFPPAPPCGSQGPVRKSNLPLLLTFSPFPSPPPFEISFPLSFLGYELSRHPAHSTPKSPPSRFFFSLLAFFPPLSERRQGPKVSMQRLTSGFFFIKPIGGRTTLAFLLAPFLFLFFSLPLLVRKATGVGAPRPFPSSPSPFVLPSEPLVLC